MSRDLWINVYSKQSGGIRLGIPWPTRKEAIKVSIHDRPQILYRLRVKIKEAAK